MNEKTNLGVLSKTDEETVVNPTEVLANVSVDNLVFAMLNGRLHVLLVKYPEETQQNRWGLIGHWVKMGESLTDAATRVVQDVTEVENLYSEQLHAFGETNRYPYNRVITIAFMSLVKLEDVSLNTTGDLELKWFDIYDLPELIFDHTEILIQATEKLRYKVRREPVGFNLLPEKFTLLQLQEVYESILNKKLIKPNFRRKILKMNLLVDTHEKQQNVSHRAANLYQFDLERYEHLKKFGFEFEF